jgi:hypothetical protein
MQNHGQKRTHVFNHSIALLFVAAVAIAWYSPWAWQAVAAANIPLSTAKLAEESPELSEWADTSAASYILREKRELGQEIRTLTTLLSSTTNLEARRGLREMINAKRDALRLISAYTQAVLARTRKLTATDAARVSSLSLMTQIRVLQQDVRRFARNSPARVLIAQRLNLLSGQNRALSAEYRALTRSRATLDEILASLEAFNVRVNRSELIATRAQRLELSSNNFSLPPSASPFVFSRTGP